MKKTIYIALAIIAFTFLSAGATLACSCVLENKPLKKLVAGAYGESGAVFTGKVTSIEETPDGSYFIVTFAVSSVWKGTAATEITVQTETQSSMCGYRFAVGREYVVYAYQATKTLGVNNCSRTAIADSNADLKYLAKLRKLKHH